MSPTSLVVGPVAIPDAATVTQDSAATDINVVANDVDPAAGGLTLTLASAAASVPTATHTVTISGNKVRFTPAAGFAGAVVVSYTIKDANNVTANGVLDITVTPTALTLNPVAVPDAATVPMPWLIVTVVAFVLDQVSVDAAPDVMEAGAPLIVTVGSVGGAAVVVNDET